MPTFKSPVHSKQVNAKGPTESSYVFGIEYNAEETGIEFVAESVEDLSVTSIQKLLTEHQGWWNEFLTSFLKQSGKFFSKQYPVQDLHKIIRHVIGDVSQIDSPVTVTLLPKHIQILQGYFTIHWNHTIQPICIDIPGLTDPVVNEIASDVAELNIDDLPIDSTDTTELNDPDKMYEKQKVKTAILKARVAYYRAQNRIRTFSDKYGAEYSDSEFELEDTENESEEEDDE